MNTSITYDDLLKKEGNKSILWVFIYKALLGDDQWSGIYKKGDYSPAPFVVTAQINGVEIDVEKVFSCIDRAIDKTIRIEAAQLALENYDKVDDDIRKLQAAFEEIRDERITKICEQLDIRPWQAFDDYDSDED